MIAAAALCSPKGKVGPVLGCDGTNWMQALHFLSVPFTVLVEVALQKRVPKDAASDGVKICAQFRASTSLQ